MHVKVALEIGKALYDFTPKGKKCCVCIVPVSGAYKKGSVQESCISQANRWKLAEAFLEAVVAENKNDVEYRLLDYEFLSIKPISTFDSLAILKSQDFCHDGTQIFVAQGQDNIFAILGRTWNRSRDLLENYHFFMFPRGEKNTDSSTLRKQMMDILTNANEKQRNVPFSEDKARHVIEKIHLVGSGFSDDTSSSKVRKMIQEGQSIDDYVHPLVLTQLHKMPGVYNDPSCEKTPVSGGKRRFKRRKTLKTKKNL
jgi:nicotinic acid mononucleotide adenylyltransferase